MSRLPQPPRYPIAHPSTLSPQAQIVYASGFRSRLDRDLLDPRTHRRYADRAAAETFEPSDALVDAIEELVAAGLADYDWAFHNLGIRDVHTHYTRATGAGAWLAEVRLVPLAYAANPLREGTLLAVIDGADLDISHTDGSWSIGRLRAPHASATDFEHSRSMTALLEIASPTLLSMNGTRSVYAGTLIDARLYPLGVDPLTAHDGDTLPGECNDTGTDHVPHPFAPYLPVERAEIQALLPSVVTITLTPATTDLVPAEQEG